MTVTNLQAAAVIGVWCPAVNGPYERGQSVSGDVGRRPGMRAESWAGTICPFDNRADFADADRGLIGSLDPGIVKDATGRVV